jgi:hypothetical protein
MSMHLSYVQSSTLGHDSSNTIAAPAGGKLPWIVAREASMWSVISIGARMKTTRAILLKDALCSDMMLANAGGLLYVYLDVASIAYI